MGPPAGTVTFLFTDIEGSTRLLRATGDGYTSLLAEHRQILRDAITRYHGHEVRTEGDSFFVTFERPSDAVNAALDAQLGLCAHPWQSGSEVRVRMGVHTGEASVVRGDYVGLAVHQAARISSAAHGRQVLLSSSTAELVRDALGERASLVDIGAHRLKDFDRPLTLYQLSHADLPQAFDAPTSIEALPTNLPAAITTFIGRDDELADVLGMLANTRLLTLTGAGGVGKTRLALELGARIVRDHADGVWLTELAPVADPASIVEAVGRALRLSDPEATSTWTERIVDHVRDKDLILVLDNCEHVVSACADVVVELLERCPKLSILATSREPLGVAGEVAWRVPSLSTTDAAAALFLERAREVSPGFAADAGVVAEISTTSGQHSSGIRLTTTAVQRRRSWAPCCGSS